MQFKNCSIAGIIYGGPLTLESINDIPQEDLEDVNSFFLFDLTN